MEQNNQPKKIEYLLLFIILALCFGLMSNRADTPFDGYHTFNEGWYSLIARNYSRHSWIEPTPYPGVTDLNVPPMYSYILYAAGRMLGFREGVFRGVSIFFSMVAVAAAFLLGRKLYGARAGLIAAGLLAFCPLFLLPGRNVQPDSTYLAFMMLGLLAYLSHSEKGGWARAAACGLLFGAALFTKQFTVFVLPALALYEISNGKGWGWINRRIAAAAAIAAAIPLIFYQYHFRHSKELLWEAQRYGALRNATIPTVKTALSAISELFFGFSPPIFILFAVIPAVALASQRKRHRFALPFAIIYILFFFAVPNHTYYIMSAIPFLALMSGDVLSRLRPRALGPTVAVLIILGGGFSSLLILGSLKYGNTRLSDICSHVRSAGGGNAMLIMDNKILGNYEPPLMYYCEGIEKIDRAKLISRSGAGPAPLDYSRKKIFYLDFTNADTGENVSPYITIYDRIYMGPSAFGAAVGYIPAQGRSFVPGRFVYKHITGAPVFGMVEISREPSLALIEAPPGYILFAGKNNLTIRKP